MGFFQTFEFPSASEREREKKNRKKEREREVNRGDIEGQSHTNWAILLWLVFFFAALLCLKLNNLHKYVPNLAREGATLLHPSNRLSRTLAPIQEYCSVGSSQWPDWRILSYRNNSSICWLVYKRQKYITRNECVSFLYNGTCSWRVT